MSSRTNILKIQRHLRPLMQTNILSPTKAGNLMRDYSKTGDAEKLIKELNALSSPDHLYGVKRAALEQIKGVLF